MSESAESTSKYKATIAFLKSVNERERKLEEDGILLETECEKCGDPLETQILPGESTDGHICTPCLKYQIRTRTASEGN